MVWKNKENWVNVIAWILWYRKGEKWLVGGEIVVNSLNIHDMDIIWKNWSYSS